MFEVNERVRYNGTTTTFKGLVGTVTHVDISNMRCRVLWDGKKSEWSHPWEKLRSAGVVPYPPEHSCSVQIAPGPVQESEAKEGVKYDAGKPRLGLVLLEVPRAFEAVGTLLGKGAEKYSVGNWKAVPNAEQRYLDAALRHLAAHHQGETVDSETQQLHLAAVAVNALFMLELELMKNAGKS